MALKTNLKRARKARGLSKRGLSVRAGLSTNAVQYLESGHTIDPCVSHVIAIAQVLGTTVEELVGRV